MKVIVFAIIGLVLGLGGGSGVAIMKARKAVVAAADSTARKDSDHVAMVAPAGGARAGAGESTEAASLATTDADTPPAASSPAPSKRDSISAPDDSRSLAGASGGSPGTALQSVASPGAQKTPAGDSSHGAASPVPAPGRIAKIFAAMSPKDAARVLQQLDDADVQTVLTGLNDKQAAAILSGFPPERAAAISRAAIRGKKGAS